MPSPSPRAGRAPDPVRPHLAHVSRARGRGCTCHRRMCAVWFNPGNGTRGPGRGRRGAAGGSPATGWSERLLGPSRVCGLRHPWRAVPGASTPPPHRRRPCPVSGLWLQPGQDPQNGARRARVGGGSRGPRIPLRRELSSGVDLRRFGDSPAEAAGPLSRRGLGGLGGSGLLLPTPRPQGARSRAGGRASAEASLHPGDGGHLPKTAPFRMPSLPGCLDLVEAGTGASVLRAEQNNCVF